MFQIYKTKINTVTDIVLNIARRLERMIERESNNYKDLTAYIKHFYEFMETRNGKVDVKSSFLNQSGVDGIQKN